MITPQEKIKELLFLKNNFRAEYDTRYLSNTIAFENYLFLLREFCEKHPDYKELLSKKYNIIQCEIDNTIWRIWIDDNLEYLQKGSFEEELYKITSIFN